jgi:hypothetical protein
VRRVWLVWRCWRLPRETWQQRRIGSDARGWFTPHRQSEYWPDSWPACGRWLKRRRRTSRWLRVLRNCRDSPLEAECSAATALSVFAKGLGFGGGDPAANKVLARAWEHAETLTSKPTLLLRRTRLMFTEYPKRRMQDLLGYGLAMEGLVCGGGHHVKDWRLRQVATLFGGVTVRLPVSLHRLWPHRDGCQLAIAAVASQTALSSRL